MKKFLGLVLLFTASVITLLQLGKVIAYEWEDIEAEALNFSDFLDERFDEAGKFIDEKVLVVLNH